MSFAVADTLALLERTPAVLQAQLRALPERWTRQNEGGESWSAYGVVGHLIVAERNWSERLRRILEHGEAKPFEPFDRRAQQRESGSKSLEDLLEEFTRARAGNLAELRRRALRPADLERRGLHPALGPVTLENLLAAWAAHDLTHLHQIARVMAHQLRAHVGPWEKNLGVLHCHGHGAA